MQAIFLYIEENNDARVRPKNFFRLLHKISTQTIYFFLEPLCEVEKDFNCDLFLNSYLNTPHEILFEENLLRWPLLSIFFETFLSYVLVEFDFMKSVQGSRNCGKQKLWEAGSTAPLAFYQQEQGG